MKDVIVIGGGPAGSTAAAYLAKGGVDVTVFERDMFPRPHVGESLIPFCYPMFEELGVLDQMEANYARKPGVKFINSTGEYGTTWYFGHVIKDPSALSFHVERASFDNRLLRNAEKLGATVQEQTAVTNVNLDTPDGTVEVTTKTKEGEVQMHKAKFVIDASGQNTFLARKFKNKDAYEGLNRVAINTHWKNPTYDKELAEGCISIVHLGGKKFGWIWMIPLSEDRLSVGTVMYTDYFKEQKKKYAGDEDWKRKLYMQELEESGIAKQILSDAMIDNEIMINGDYSYYTPTKYGDNYAIVGDAASFLDPIFSSGIYVGMAASKLVSEQLTAKLKEGKSTDETLKVAYKQINGAYDFIEKLIRTFYDPDAISLASLSQVKDEDFEKFEAAYTIYHYMLAGDFFNNYEKYYSTMDLLKDTKNLEKYKNIIDSKHGAAAT